MQCLQTGYHSPQDEPPILVYQHTESSGPFRLATGCSSLALVLIKCELVQCWCNAIIIMFHTCLYRYNVMLCCWQLEPLLRPDFVELKTEFDSMLSEHTDQVMCAVSCCH